MTTNPTTPPPAPKPAAPAKPAIVTQPRHDKSVITQKVDLSLEWNGLFHAYKVISITNTTWYKPGEWLSEDVVTACCQTKGWSVTMAHDDFFKNLLMQVIQLPSLSMESLPKLP